MSGLYPMIRRQRRPLGSVPVDANQFRELGEAKARADAEVKGLADENARLMAEVQRLTDDNNRLAAELAAKGKGACTRPSGQVQRQKARGLQGEVTPALSAVADGAASDSGNANISE